MKKMLLALVSAAALLTSAHAETFVYNLNHQYFPQGDPNGPALVPHGGTLGPHGYYFGVNEGLSLSGTGAFDVYSIEIKFYFDNVNASFDGYQRIIDFQNRTSDSGLYSRNGSLVFYGRGGSAGTVFTNGTMADLLVTRDTSGLFSAYVNGTLAFSFNMDNVPGIYCGGYTYSPCSTISGPDNIIYFFMDDLLSLTNYPNLPEAGTGFIDQIIVTVPDVPLPPSAIPFGSGLGLLGLLGWRRKRAQKAST